MPIRVGQNPNALRPAQGKQTMQLPEASESRPAAQNDPKGKATLFPRADRASVALIFAVIVGLAGIGLFQQFGTSLIPMLEDKDQISEQQARDRARAFKASTPLELRFVAAGEIPQALATMRLSDNDKAFLL